MLRIFYKSLEILIVSNNKINEKLDLSDIPQNII